MNSVLLVGLRLSKNSSLFKIGLLTTSRLPLTLEFYFMPTRVLTRALDGIDLTSYRCLAGMLKTWTSFLDRGRFLREP